MLTCKNCNRKFSCSCNIRTASNGTSCCSLCLLQIEEKIKAEKAKSNG